MPFRPSGVFVRTKRRATRLRERRCPNWAIAESHLATSYQMRSQGSSRGRELKVSYSAANVILTRLVKQREVTSFSTNFAGCNETFFRPKVTVSIRARDEVAIHRARRRVQAALEPAVGDVTVTVQPDQRAEVGDEHRS